ncbi:MAG: hypothetical protein ACXVZX_08240, partial [Terriglobales bacterium]
IQRFLEDLPYHHANTAWSPRLVLRKRTAHCLEGAIFAAAALRVNGFKPLLWDLEGIRDTDHVLAIYPYDGHWERSPSRTSPDCVSESRCIDRCANWR